MTPLRRVVTSSAPSVSTACHCISPTDALLNEPIEHSGSYLVERIDDLAVRLEGQVDRSILSFNDLPLSDALLEALVMHPGMDGPHDYAVHLKINDASNPDVVVRVLSNWEP